MKRYLSKIIIALVAVLGLTSLVACQQTEQPQHQHTNGDTWERDSAQHWHECGECGEMYDLALHSYGDWVIETEVTNTEDGLRKRTCSVCGFVQSEVIAKPTQYYVRGIGEDWSPTEERKVVINFETMVATIEIEISTEDEFKVADEGWNKEFGAETIEAEEGLLATEAGNIKVAESGTYVITVTGVNTANPTCTIAKK